MAAEAGKEHLCSGISKADRQEAAYFVDAALQYPRLHLWFALT
jgi:hypothetical protein